jgi:hypothetical protein
MSEQEQIERLLMVVERAVELGPDLQPVGTLAMPGRRGLISDLWGDGLLDVEVLQGQAGYPSGFTHIVTGEIAGKRRGYLVEAHGTAVTLPAAAHDHLTRAALERLRREGTEATREALANARQRVVHEAVTQHIDTLRAGRWTAEFAILLGHGWQHSARIA